MGGRRKGPGLGHCGPTTQSPSFSSEMEGDQAHAPPEHAHRYTEITVSAQLLKFKGNLPSVPLSSTLTDWFTGIWALRGWLEVPASQCKVGFRRGLPEPPCVSQCHVTGTL